MMPRRKILSFTILGLGIAAMTFSCKKDYKRNPGRVYAPDMTYSRAYETYSENPNFANDATNRVPVKGAVARGTFGTPIFQEQDSLRVYALTNPLDITASDLEDGERYFNIYCAPCHGTGLDGNGPLYESGKYPLAPANLKSGAKAELSSGQYYYTILFGKNMMGSYASQLTEKQRWQVIAYIKDANGSAPASSASAASIAIPSTETATAEEGTEEGTDMTNEENQN